MTDLDSRYTNFLRTQAKTADSASESLPCPFCNEGRIFQSGDQLWSHASLDHKSDLQILGKPDRARAQLLRRSKALADQSSDATAGGGSTLDLAQLSLDTPGKDRSSTPLDPRVGEKRPAGLDYATAPTRQSKIIGKTEVYDPDYSRDMPYTLPAEPTRSKPSTSRLYDPKQDAKAGSPYLRSTPAQSSEDWSVEANKSQYPTGHHHSSSTHSPHSQRPPANIVNPTSPSRGQYASPQRQQPGLLEI